MYRHFPREIPLFRGEFRQLNKQTILSPLSEGDMNVFSLTKIISQTYNHERVGIYPTIFEVLCNLEDYNIPRHKYSSLYREHRHRLGDRVPSLNGYRIPAAPPFVPSFVYSEEDFPAYHPQSGITSDSNIMQFTDGQQQNVDFTGMQDPYLYQVKSTMDPTRCMQDTDEMSLDKFHR